MKEPIIVEQVYDGMIQAVRVNESGRRITENDVLRVIRHEVQMLVRNTEHVEDLFEDFVFINLIPVANSGQRIKDLLRPGDELIIFASVMKNH